MMTNEQKLIERYRGAALRFWFEPESSYEMEFESYEEFYEYLFKDIALCPKGMSRESYIVARCYYIFEYEAAVERVLSGIHSARHFDSDWESTPYRYDPRDNSEHTERFLHDVYEAATSI
jgi:hypothetical protein